MLNRANNLELIMRAFNTIALLTGLLLTPMTYAISQYADPGTNETVTLNELKALQLQLFNDLDSGDIRCATFDQKAETDIATTQMEMAKYYLEQGDRKNAIISAIQARKIMQSLYTNPNDPQLIPIYSLLVQIYESSVDTDNPNVNMANADKAKQYREEIDHIHAE